MTEDEERAHCDSEARSFLNLTCMAPQLDEVEALLIRERAAARNEERERCRLLALNRGDLVLANAIEIGCQS